MRTMVGFVYSINPLVKSRILPRKLAKVTPVLIVINFKDRKGETFGDIHLAYPRLEFHFSLYS